MRDERSICKQHWMLAVGQMIIMVMRVASTDYGDALSKSILFFEGQRSGRLPPTQRMTWRKDSALHDGFDQGVDLLGGYYDAGDNVKFNFPMAFTTTMLAWSVLEFGDFMDADLQHAVEAIRWATDYFLKATIVNGTVFVQVCDPWADHNCWERPKDMDVPRTSYAVTAENPGSEVYGEIAAASSMLFKGLSAQYSKLLLRRAKMVFEFAEKYQGSYNDSLGPWVCPFYCDFSGYESLSFDPSLYMLCIQFVMSNTTNSAPFLPNADKFICSVLPESPTKSVTYSPGGLLFKAGGSNMQHPTALRFLFLAYANYLKDANRMIRCDNVVATPSRLINFAKGQVDYILRKNPMNMSYMVGYGENFPKRIHRRGSSLPSIDQHPEHIEAASRDYGDALSKSILFFEGQRSGKLPPTQRVTWRRDSALTDVFDLGVDLVGGYYDAGDNVKFNFPMAFSTTMLAWSITEFGKSMVGSEVSAEIAAALAASSVVFKSFDRGYSQLLLQSASKVFDFADTYRGSYDDSIGQLVCPFYCDYSGYQDELLWAAAWLHKATRATFYWTYVTENIHNLSSFTEFGWDAKHAGINVLISKYILINSLDSAPFLQNADKLVCSILPESPTLGVEYSPGIIGVQLLKIDAYARYLKSANRVVQCDNFVATPSRLIHFARGQVDYMLGKNPLNMSYMVGYGRKFPQRIHHRGSSLPSVDQHPEHIDCKGGTPYFSSNGANPNLLIGAVVGGPDINDSYADSRADFAHSEPTTYVNAPLVGLFAYFRAHS
ncbi:hypothetical protein RJ639_027808 [Escallonia herrerae]|uniref:Endoglucanase n=1 Tax=Escallonia herrerae TaxID=1293975 RepID=A0AA89BKL6_9ASTE|nr:hypothetical protein RJ639_027808 [Escallonia herrerae]